MEMKEYAPKEILLFQAVSDLLSEGGSVDKLRVSEIAKRAGIGKGTVYEYFSSKEELIAKAVYYSLQKHFLRVKNAMLKQEGFEAKIYAMLENLYAGYKGEKKDCGWFMYLFDERQPIPEGLKAELKKLSLTEVDIKNICSALYRAARTEESVADDLPEFYVRCAFFDLFTAYGSYLKLSGKEKLPDKEAVMKRLYENLIFALRA